MPDTRSRARRNFSVQTNSLWMIDRQFAKFDKSENILPLSCARSTQVASRNANMVALAYCQILLRHRMQPGTLRRLGNRHRIVGIGLDIQNIGLLPPRRQQFDQQTKLLKIASQKMSAVTCFHRHTANFRCLHVGKTPWHPDLDLAF